MHQLMQRPKAARTLATLSAAAVLLFGGAGAAMAQQAPPEQEAAQTDTAAEPETGTAAEPETGTAQGHMKETICHKPGTPAEKTKEVPSPAVQNHLDHGDERGECPEDADAETGTVTAKP